MERVSYVRTWPERSVSMVSKMARMLAKSSGVMRCNRNTCHDAGVNDAQVGVEAENMPEEVR